MLFCINNDLPSTIFPELDKEPREIYNDTVMYSDDEDYIDVHEILDLDDAGEWRCEVDEYVNLEYDFQYKKKLKDLSKRDLDDEQFMLEYKRYRNVVKDRIENIKEMQEAEEEKLKEKEKKEKKEEKEKKEKEYKEDLLVIESIKENNIRECSFRLDFVKQSYFYSINIETIYKISLCTKLIFNLEILFLRRQQFLRNINVFYMLDNKINSNLAVK